MKPERKQPTGESGTLSIDISCILLAYRWYTYTVASRAGGGGGGADEFHVHVQVIALHSHMRTTLLNYATKIRRWLEQFAVTRYNSGSVHDFT